MHKTDLVTAVAQRTGLNNDKADAVVSAFIELVTNALSRNESVALTGFGSFAVVQRAARTGRNPSTGAEIMIAARQDVVFKPGKAFKEAIRHSTAL